MREGERGRERWRERYKEIEREKQRDREREGEIDRKREREREKESEGERERGRKYSSSPRYTVYRFLPVFGTVDTSKGWNSQVCPRAIGGINTCHKMRHSLSLPTVTYICMGELPHFHHGQTTSFLLSQPIQTPPSGPGLICATGQVFIWDDPSVMRE